MILNIVVRRRALNHFDKDSRTFMFGIGENEVISKLMEEQGVTTEMIMEIRDSSIIQSILDGFKEEKYSNVGVLRWWCRDIDRIERFAFYHEN